MGKPTQPGYGNPSPIKNHGEASKTQSSAKSSTRKREQSQPQVKGRKSKVTTSRGPRPSKASAESKRAKVRSGMLVTLKMLLDNGYVKAGQSILVLSYKGVTVPLHLKANGTIVW